MGNDTSCCSCSNSAEINEMHSAAPITACTPQCPEECPEMGEDGEEYGQPKPAWGQLGKVSSKVKPGALAIRFRLPDHSYRDVVFTQTPLGLDFNKTAPIVMKRVKAGSQGQLLGVQPSWEIHYINGQDVSRADFSSTFELLKQASKVLKEQRS
eukprot:TRINITY_DN10343_c0_g2_i1.p1 TRINITY_DN10343_c0_g2~~TRINITY_DN10343_c0_g2_i1.p1  ORF type:complete len:154 (+),score=23.40 TRINITY_DN10343_c0_g2_i1:79-540(+)